MRALVASMAMAASALSVGCTDLGLITISVITDVTAERECASCAAKPETIKEGPLPQGPPQPTSLNCLGLDSMRRPVILPWEHCDVQMIDQFGRPADHLAAPAPVAGVVSPPRDAVSPSRDTGGGYDGGGSTSRTARRQGDGMPNEMVGEPKDAYNWD